MKSPELAQPPLSKSRWRGLPAFTALELRVQLHEYPSLGGAVVVQAVFLLFIWLVGAHSLLPYAVVGAVIFSVFTVGERVQNEAAYIRLDHKLNELYHASPLTPESYFMGIAGAILLAYSPPVLILAGVAEVIHPFSPVSLGVLVASLLAVWIFSSCLGYFISTLFRDMRAIWPYATITFNLFGVLPPVFYPLWYFPEQLRDLALVMPPSAAAALTLSTLGEYSGPNALSSGELWLAGVSLAVEAVAMFVFVVYWSRRMVREV